MRQWHIKYIAQSLAQSQCPLYMLAVLIFMYYNFHVSHGVGTGLPFWRGDRVPREAK